MKPKVYIETSVISYLTAKLSRDLITAGHQKITQEWWKHRRQEFTLHISQLVVKEASAGNTTAASKNSANSDSDNQGVNVMNNTVVFINALDSEYQAVLAYLKNPQGQPYKGSNYQSGDYFTPTQQRWQVVVRKQADQGNPAAAQETERAISGFQPQYVFFVGVAGGIKDVNWGDVVAAKTVRGYEKGKVHSNETIVRGDVHHCSSALQHLADKVVN